MTLAQLLTQPPHTPVTLQAWVRTKRTSRKVAFLSLYDGSCHADIQAVVVRQQAHEALLAAITTGAAVRIEGTLVPSQGTEQTLEIQAHTLTLLGEAPADTYPLQPKKHTMAFLRSQQHLRFRTRTFRAIFRIRHLVSHAIHTFFHTRGFSWVHTPILTSIDAEGAGDLFKVSAGTTPFFGKQAYLTVSGQLAGEAAAMGLGKIYTFGPTFRAEHSNTTRHLAEFWMVEPEIAFYDLPATITLAQELLQAVATTLLESCSDELAWLTQATASTQPVDLQKRLSVLQADKMVQYTYTQALHMLQAAVAADKVTFEHPVAPWGVPLQTEHERYLTHQLGTAVVITHFPKASKAFYMRQNSDGKTVAAMDILLPEVGEVIGGAQREERLHHLVEAMQRQGMDQEALQWYVDTRRFGSVPHSGFGLGLERLLQFATGIHNIRDLIPFPRTPGHMVG